MLPRGLISELARVAWGMLEQTIPLVPGGVPENSFMSPVLRQSPWRCIQNVMSYIGLIDGYLNYHLWLGLPCDHMERVFSFFKMLTVDHSPDRWFVAFVSDVCPLHGVWIGVL